MNWQEPREQLQLSKIGYNKLHNPIKPNQQERLDILKNNKYTCRSCGGTYASYLILVYVANENAYDTQCPFCNTLTKLNNGISSGIELCYTELSQLDIIKKTVDYVIANNTTPNILMIDPDAKYVDISLLEYVNIMEHITDDNFKNYKIFFNNNFNITFITNNYCKGMSLFVDESSYEKSFTIDIHPLQPNEIKFLNNLFIK